MGLSLDDVTFPGMLLLAEEMIGSPGHLPTDYKFFVFNGEVARAARSTGQ
jgi:hypothetical protein